MHWRFHSVASKKVRQQRCKHYQLDMTEYFEYTKNCEIINVVFIIIIIVITTLTIKLCQLRLSLSTFSALYYVFSSIFYSPCSLLFSVLYSVLYSLFFILCSILSYLFSLLSIFYSPQDRSGTKNLEVFGAFCLLVSVSWRSELLPPWRSLLNTTSVTSCSDDWPLQGSSL